MLDSTWRVLGIKLGNGGGREGRGGEEKGRDSRGMRREERGKELSEGSGVERRGH